eukprot:TRINITY_DN18350_c0_g1_i3.p1 TRINITY_DN18350_c0_g1~~TRINITY_DN18350_c0_g1_i3.p1  ORF type:complete len:279 (-),score=66.67 TRINITY_DN18350_c0_g1_i3:611-1447(-)
MVQGELCASAPRSSGAYKGVVDALLTIGRREGLQGLQRGLRPACMLQFSNVSMRFGSYAVLKRALNVDPGRSAAGWLGAFALGGFSGFMSAAVSNPFFLLKTRAQAARDGSAECPSRANRVMANIKDIVQKDGLAGLYRGFPAFAARVMAASSVQLSTYDRTKHVFTDRLGMTNGFGVHFCASWVTSVAVIFAMQPFDFVATRLMNQGQSTTELYKGPYDCLKKTVQAEGLGGVYKGILANYMRFGPYCILVFVFLEQLRNAETSAFDMMEAIERRTH